MIGRESDLAALREELEAVAAGQPRAAVIGGEAGIGKTRLLDEFRAEAVRSAIVVSGRSVDLGTGGAPYAPFTGVLRQLIDTLGRDEVIAAAGPGAGALSVLLPELSAAEGMPARTGADRLYELVTVLLENVSTVRPLVIVIEDLHWADTATLELIRFVVRMLAAGRVLLVLSYRSDEVLRGHPLRSYLPELDRTRRVTRWELARLARDQVAVQVERILGCTPDADTVDRVYRLSEGVPFFVEELVGIDDLGTGEDLPETLRELLLARYERLSEAAQRLLRLISAGGVCVDHALLATVFEGTADELDEAAREAVVANVLSADSTEYTFRHALVREAIHADLLPGERTRFHTRYALALEQEQENHEPGDRRERSASQISSHWMAAHDLRRAFTATLEAMEEARVSYAYRTAAEMGDRALELWDQVHDAEAIAGRSHTELLSSTASALRNAGDNERALALVNVALADAGGLPPARRARLLRDKAQYLANLSRPGSVELLQEALALPEPGDALRPQLLAEVAGRLMLEARYDEAIEMSTLAIDEAGAADPARASIARTVRGIASIDRGDIEEGVADLDRARELAGGEAGALLRNSVNASDAMNVLGRYRDAVAIAEAGAAQARAHGVERTSGVMLSSNTVEPLFALGELDRAERLLDPALALDPPPLFRVHLQRMKLWLTLWRGEIDRAEELARRWRPAMLVQAEIEMQSRLGFARVAAELSIARGDPERAWSEAGVITSPSWRSIPAYDLPLLAVAARTLAVLADRRRSGTTPADNRSIAPGSAATDAPVSIAAEAGALRAILAGLTAWPTYPVWAPLIEAELESIGPGVAAGDEPEGVSGESSAGVRDSAGARDTAELVRAWQEAVDAACSPLAPAHLRPYALLRLAEALVLAGDRGRAETAAAESRERAHVLGFGLIEHAVDELDGNAALVRHAPSRAPGSALTDREAQVLALIEQGLSNKQIGEKLYISAKTASVHVSSILKKVGAASRTEAVYRASHAR